jgi:hypothetical protein
MFFGYTSCLISHIHMSKTILKFLGTFLQIRLSSGLWMQGIEWLRNSENKWKMCKQNKMSSGNAVTRLKYKNYKEKTYHKPHRCII